MSTALEIFDIFQTIVISIFLVITIPFASFIFFKLIFTRPFSESYTFKLIVLNGIMELLNCVSYLIVYQLISYPFMAGMYDFLRETGLVAPLTISSGFFAGFSLHTSLFIALNRLKTIMFIRQRHDDSKFFYVSVIFSTVLTGPAVADLCLFTTLLYLPYTYYDETILIPHNVVTNKSLRVVTDIIRIFVSLTTLVINIILSVLMTREQKYMNFAERQKFKGEKGLVITSIVSYTFYMIHFVNTVLARYPNVLFCGYSQWLTLGFNAMTPFCSFIFFCYIHFVTGVFCYSLRLFEDCFRK